jgi:hypothetical protein
MPEQYDPSKDTRDFTYGKVGSSYMGSDVMSQLPQGQTLVQPGLTENLTGDTLDVLWKATEEARKRAREATQAKAIEAETERIRNEWFFNKTADQLKATKLAIQARNSMFPPEPKRMNAGGIDVIRMLGAGGNVVDRFAPRSPVVKPAPKPWGPPTQMNIGGQDRTVQTDPITGRVHPIGSAPPKATQENDSWVIRMKMTDLKDQEKEIDKAITDNNDNEPYPGEEEEHLKNPKKFQIRLAEIKNWRQTNSKLLADKEAIRKDREDLLKQSSGQGGPNRNAMPQIQPAPQPVQGRKLTKEVAQRFYDSTDTSLPIKDRMEQAKLMSHAEGWEE